MSLDDMADRAARSYRNRCTADAARVLPMLPHKFDKLIKTKVFTKGETDCSIVIVDYDRNFAQTMLYVERFDY